ncbi:MAG: hypothetical protein V1918_02550, partial [Planctomycetota bacterium]
LKKKVTVLMEETYKSRDKDLPPIRTFYNCDEAGLCDKTFFCRFVNPLTTRNPLELVEESPAHATA